MNTHSKNNSDSGFFKLIAIIIIAAAILTFFGYNPKVLWDSYAVPTILWVWEVLYTIISFVIDIVMSFVTAFKTQ
jgi:hypothetical protein